VRDDPFDVDADSVDGQWTHELYLESNGSFDNAARFVGKADALSPEVAAKRKALRKRVGAITQRIVRERVAPLVRARYPRLCGRSAARACTLCHSLIRRYLPDERRSHGLHFDLQSAVTVVVSLSDHGREYQGGLRIQADGDTAQLLPLARGDALMHESDLQHGVHVGDDKGKRWSWTESGLKSPPRVSIVALMSGERAKSRSGERVEIPSESFHRSADERRAG